MTGKRTPLGALLPVPECWGCWRRRRSWVHGRGGWLGYTRRGELLRCWAAGVGAGVTLFAIVAWELVLVGWEIGG